MFLIEDKKGRELDRWSTLELAVESAKQFLREDPKRGALTIWEGNQQTGKRTKVQTVRHSSKESNPASGPPNEADTGTGTSNQEKKPE